MKTAVLALALAGIAPIASDAPERQDAPPKVRVTLGRVYTEGESQAYTFEFKISAGGMAFSETGAYNFKITEVLEGGHANLEWAVTEKKVTFGAETMPTDELPEPKTIRFQENGMPLELNPEEDEILSLALISGFVPKGEFELGGEFQVKWEAKDGEAKLDGEGTLVATGRLYEEHVAKLQMSLTLKDKENPPVDLELTSYVNSKTGKVVKVEGKMTAEDPDAGEVEGSFTIAKVRQK